MGYICRSLCLIVLGLSIAGCGQPKGPPTGTVTGKVTFDGQPLAEGSISFMPVDRMGTTSGAKITNGTYKADVPLGSKRVEIRSPKVVGQKDAYQGDPKSPKIDIIEELIPPRYNAQSELKADVVAGPNKGDFTLTTPAK